MYGRAEDVSQLDLTEVERELSELQLPRHLAQLWQRFFEQRATR